MNYTSDNRKVDFKKSAFKSEKEAANEKYAKDWKLELLALSGFCLFGQCCLDCVLSLLDDSIQKIFLRLIPARKFFKASFYSSGRSHLADSIKKSVSSLRDNELFDARSRRFRIQMS
jgi:hypothetical protein